jgi:hypothetical protein
VATCGNHLRHSVSNWLDRRFIFARESQNVTVEYHPVLRQKLWWTWSPGVCTLTALTSTPTAGSQSGPSRRPRLAAPGAAVKGHKRTLAPQQTTPLLGTESIRWDERIRNFDADLAIVADSPGMERQEGVFYHIRRESIARRQSCFHKSGLVFEDRFNQ